MKPLHEMTKREANECLRSLYHAQPKADWERLAVGNIILHKGYGWRIQHVPPKRGFVMAANLAMGQVEKLLRSRYDSSDLLVTDEATIVVLKTSHLDGIKTAMAVGISISPLVQYDYPELFTPYPKSWDEKRCEKAQDTWSRINEMQAFHDSQDGPGWQFGMVKDLIARAKKDIVEWEQYRGECEAGVKITKPEAIPRIVASVNDNIRESKEQIEILRHLRKHLEKTVTRSKSVRRNRPKGRKKMNPKFQLGELLATPAALKAIEDAGQEPGFFWKNMPKEIGAKVCVADGQANDEALVDGSRILSAYKTLKGVRIWIITEAADDEGRRAVTTAMLPEEY